MTFTPEQTALLNAPLNRSNVKERKMAGRNMSYIEGWHAIAEANRIFGFDGWSRETVMLQETSRDLVDLTSDRGSYKQWRISYIARVRITAGGIVREGTGYGSGMGKPEAIGDAVEGSIKEAETDAMKRALMTFGNPFGLALYDKEQTDVVTDPKPTPKTAPAPHAVFAPAPTQPAQTPASWLENSAKAVKTMTREQLDRFTEEQGPRMVRVKTLNPGLHKALMDAIQLRQSELF